MTAKPWYDESEKWIEKAALYSEALRALSVDDQRQAVIIEYRHMARAIVIFESNIIEGSGEELGDTKRIIAEYFPDVPKSPDAFEVFMNEQGGERTFFTKGHLDKFHLAMTKNEKKAKAKVIKPSVQFGDKSRGFREVAQHYETLVYAVEASGEYSSNRLYRWVRQILKEELKEASDKKDTFTTYLARFLKSKNVTRLRPKKLLTKTCLNTMHKILATGLLPTNCPTQAGQYRTDGAYINADVIFPVPSILPQAMDLFLTRSHKQLEESITYADHIRAAADISYDFVSIHPYPDFNGRMSRLIMNMVLQSWNQFTIPVTFRSDKKGRRCYLTALKHANRGKHKSMHALVAMRICEVFEGLDKQCIAAGLPTLIERL